MRLVFDLRQRLIIKYRAVRAFEAFIGMCSEAITEITQAFVLRLVTVKALALDVIIGRGLDQRRGDQRHGGGGFAIRLTHYSEVLGYRNFLEKCEIPSIVCP